MYPTFDTAFYKILNAIGDICERIRHEVLFYVVIKFLRFNLSQCNCSRYHDIQKMGGK